jgi:hypothetical protein
VRASLSSDLSVSLSVDVPMCITCVEYTRWERKKSEPKLAPKRTVTSLSALFPLNK